MPQVDDVSDRLSQPSARRRRARRWSVCIGLGVVLVASASSAQDVVRVRSATLVGDSTVTVPVEAATSTPLTLLSVDVRFDPRLCDRVAIEVRQAGRAAVGPEEGGIACADGRIRIVLLDLEGGVVVPAGEGPIAELGLSVTGSRSLDVPIAVVVNEARDRREAVALTAEGGVWSIPRAACPGDCNADGEVTINELITGVNIALGSASVDSCEGVDVNGDGEVTINELIAAVNNGLNGCPS